MEFLQKNLLIFGIVNFNYKCHYLEYFLNLLMAVCHQNQLTKDGVLIFSFFAISILSLSNFKTIFSDFNVQIKTFIFY